MIFWGARPSARTLWYVQGIARSLWEIRIAISRMRDIRKANRKRVVDTNKREIRLPGGNSDLVFAQADPKTGSKLFISIYAKSCNRTTTRFGKVSRLLGLHLTTT